jgi:hypothetical protein
MRYIILTIGFLGVFSLIVHPCAGIEPDKVEGIVYRLQSHTGTEHKILYSPPQVEEIYLLAGTDNIIDPRYTLVYYWPLSREYFASWERLDVPVEGKLEILKNGGMIQTLPREEVVLSYPKGASRGRSIVLKGEKAIMKQKEYETLADKFEEEVAAFGQKILQYRKNLKEFMKGDVSGNPGAVLPKPPVEPVPPILYVSNLMKTFVVNLPVGRYSIRIRAEDGTIVEGSERNLVLFQPLQEEGIGYEIMPEERWTVRLSADDSDGGIYCEPGKALFLIPFRTTAYDESSYIRLINPQGLGREGVLEWIHKDRIENMRLLLLSHGKLVRMVEWKKYYVKQVPGAELGYKIIEYDEEAASGESPTFSGFFLSFEEKDSGNRYEIVLENLVTGERISGSKRKLRIIGKTGVSSLWAISFIPSVLGSCMFVWRRKKGIELKKT